jgi:hypothetical protein
MMSGMFASARVLARSSSRTGEGAAGESRSALFRRLYRGDFDAEELAAVSAHLDAVASE